LKVPIGKTTDTSETQNERQGDTALLPKASNKIIGKISNIVDYHNIDNKSFNLE
jgi:hypothetical protein